MKEKYTFGILGAGMIAEHHILNLQKTGRATVKWIAATKPEKVRQVGAKYGVGHTTVDYSEILDDPEVDAVVVCTPPFLHKTMFVESLRAGKHVLVEKPLAMSLKEADTMIRVSRQFPRQKVMDCSARHSRLQPKFRRVKEIIDSGALGDIYYIHHNCVWRQSRGGIEYHPTAKWFLDKSVAGGGPMFDWGVYDLSFHLGILGDEVRLEKVDAVLLKSGLDAVDPGTEVYDVEEHFAAHLQLSGNIRFYWERAAHANMETPNETRVYGARGGIRLGYCSWDEPVIEFFDVDNGGKGKARKEIIDVDMDGHDDAYALIEHFINVLDGKETPAMPLELARKHLDIIFQCYRKAEEGGDG